MTELRVEYIAVGDEKMPAVGMGIWKIDTADTAKALSQNRRFNDPAVFCEKAFGTFCTIYD